MKRLLRLYPRAWRDRYGAEMAAMVDDLPGGVGAALDLLLGAGAAYAYAIRANRLLSAAAAYLHGLCVAFFVQAIAFVSLVLVSQQFRSPTVVELGSIRFAVVTPQTVNYLGSLAAVIRIQTVGDSLSALALLAILVALFALVLAMPGWLRRSTA